MAETVDDDERALSCRAPPVPGVIAVFSDGAPRHEIFEVGRTPVVLGRVEEGPGLTDPRMSRQHASVAFDGVAWHVIDHGSRNGTYADGLRVEGRVAVPRPRVLRLGGTMFVVVPDVQPHREHPVATTDDVVVGPTLRHALDSIGRAARAGPTLLLTGESGSGKENAARVFHGKGGRASGPFVAVNCAAIPEGVAERLLFGARKGAFSGADRDAQGYIEAASGGVLFLDEIGELDLEVQAKLLRFVESREIVPLGASRPKRVDVGLVCATHRDLRADAATGRMRADLYYRISLLTVALPPLRVRLEEIPWILTRSLHEQASDRTLHASFVEACLLRRWPGNVRELLGALQSALHQAGGERELRRSHLHSDAGVALDEGSSAGAGGKSLAEGIEEINASAAAAEMRPSSAPPPPALPGNEGDPAQLRRLLDEAEKQRVLDALRQCGGNQTEAARLLGVARGTLISRMAAFQIARPRKGHDGGEET